MINFQNKQYIHITEIICNCSMVNSFSQHNKVDIKNLNNIEYSNQFSDLKVIHVPIYYVRVHLITNDFYRGNYTIRVINIIQR